MKINKWVIGVVVLIVVVAGFLLLNNNKGVAPAQAGTIRIGIMTDLTGPAAYWGESTRIGAEIAAQDLKAKGYDVQLVYADYGLDATKAASAAQKLANVDKVDAVYVEFNPGAIAAASILKGKNIPMIYDAAIVSPLGSSNNFFKTYLDYQAGCKAVAQKFKDEGISTIGMLKLNLEAGDLCLAGVKSVYGDKVVIESFNLGDTDFRTQLLKINSAGAGAVINVGFEGDTYNALQVIKNQSYKMKYGTVDDTITDKVKKAFHDQLKGAWAFGFKDPSTSFTSRVDAAAGNTKLSTYYAAAEAFTHIPQLVISLADCAKDIACTAQRIASASADSNSGFKGYQNRIANLQMNIKQY